MITEIQNRLINATKVRDKRHISILRDIKNNLIGAEKLKKKELSQDECFAVLKRMAKQRQQSIDACGDNYKYQDLKLNELFELSIIQEYLPEPLSHEEIQSKIVEIINILNLPHGLESLGKVMKSFNEQYQGQDGKIVSQIARECLMS